MIQSSIIEMKLTNHELIYCSRKTKRLKLHETQRNFTKVNVKLLKQNFCGKFKFSKIFLATQIMPV